MLTDERLGDVLEEAQRQGAHILLLQETRHPPGGFGWATRRLNKQGWRLVWSPATDFDVLGRRRPGGTMLAWRPELGKGAPIPLELPPAQAHRALARRFETFEIANVYLPAASPDLPLALRLQEAMASQGPGEGGPKILAGDFNWWPRYRDLKQGSF